MLDLCRDSRTDVSTAGKPYERLRQMLSNVCRHYKTVIAAFDIQTCRCDMYGSGDGYKRQCFLLYDGLHYDALAVEAYSGAPESADITVVDINDIDLAQVCLQHRLAISRPWNRDAASSFPEGHIP
jgi:hypothetical protein